MRMTEELHEDLSEKFREDVRKATIAEIASAIRASLDGDTMAFVIAMLEARYELSTSDTLDDLLSEMTKRQ